MATEETILKRNIRQYMRLNGWFIFHVLQGLGAYRGISDMIAIKDGRTVFVEVKRPKGKQSANQIQFQKDVEEHGGEYWVIKSLDYLIEKLASPQDGG